MFDINIPFNFKKFNKFENLKFLEEIMLYEIIKTI